MGTRTSAHFSPIFCVLNGLSSSVFHNEKAKGLVYLCYLSADQSVSNERRPGARLQGEG